MPKPPFRVPSMAEIAAVPPSRYRVASLFAGAGGSSLGYRMAGYRVLYAAEFVDHAADTYAANHPGAALDRRDVRDIAVVDVLDACRAAPGELDLLDGSPPCDAFSTSGAGARRWGEIKDYAPGRKQRTDDLFLEFARILAGVRPRVFVAENVAGLVRGQARGKFREFMIALKACGYEVAARMIDAQWLGVPQKRPRLIFVGVRRDLASRYALAPAFPEPLPYRYSIRDAIGPWLERDGHPDNPVERECYVAGYAVERLVPGIPMGGSHPKRTNLKRPHPDDPSFAMVAANGSSGSTAGVLHPYRNRKWTVAETKRLCTFPDDYALEGSYAERFARLGQAVPPRMMEHIARAVRVGILDRVPAGEYTAARVGGV